MVLKSVIEHRSIVNVVFGLLDLLTCITQRTPLPMMYLLPSISFRFLANKSVMGATVSANQNLSSLKVKFPLTYFFYVALDCCYIVPTRL